MEGKGWKKDASHAKLWASIVCFEAFLYLSLQQLETAKRSFQRVMAWPGVSPIERMAALQGMATIHKERKEWDQAIEYCKEGLVLLPAAKGSKGIRPTEVRLLILLADVAEAQGDLGRAHEYDKEANKAWHGTGKTNGNFELMACYRREAVQLLASGRAGEAVLLLQDYTSAYADRLDNSGST